MTIKLHIEGDRILTESGVEVGWHGQDKRYGAFHTLNGDPEVQWYKTLPEAEAAYNEHLDAIGVVSRVELDEAVAALEDVVNKVVEPLNEAFRLLGDSTPWGPCWQKAFAVIKKHKEGRDASKHYWWCPRCQCEVDGQRVTYEELHDVCGAMVESKEAQDADSK